MTYSESQREYWAKRPASTDKIVYLCVSFRHPDIDDQDLVANQFSDKEFGGITYRATAMDVPNVTTQSEDSTQAGAITFGRIGLLFRKELLKITPLGSLTPITVILRQYQGGALIYERSLFVAGDGISFNSDTVEVRLAVDNPAKLTREDQFYDAQTWVGLVGV